MKDKITEVLGNGIPYGMLFFTISVLTGYVFGLSKPDTLEISIIMGVAAMLANGLIYTRFSVPVKKLEGITAAFNESELMWLQSPASFLATDHMIPGKLFLTSERLFFKPYAAPGTEPYTYSWLLNNIKPAGFIGSLQNAGGVIQLTTHENHRLVFEVNKLKAWKKTLLQYLPA